MALTARQRRANDQLRRDKEKMRKTLIDVLDQFGYVDWCYENNMGQAHISISKSQLAKWCETAGMTVPEQDSDFYRDNS